MRLVPMIALVLVAVGRVGLAADSAAAEEAAARMLAAANRARADQNLPPLAIDPRLARAAQLRAERLASGGGLSHTGPDGTGLEARLAEAGYPFRIAAENLGEGLASPEDTVAMWLRSPSHRNNLLLPSVIHAGIGHAAAPGETGMRDYWVLVLGAPFPSQGR